MNCRTIRYYCQSYFQGYSFLCYILILSFIVSTHTLSWLGVHDNDNTYISSHWDVTDGTQTHDSDPHYDRLSCDLNQWPTDHVIDTLTNSATVAPHSGSYNNILIIELSKLQFEKKMQSKSVVRTFADCLYIMFDSGMKHEILYTPQYCQLQNSETSIHLHIGRSKGSH